MRRDRWLRLMAVGLLSVLCPGCERHDAPTPASPSGRMRDVPAAASQPLPDPSAQAEASEIFATRCTPCHGMQGRGDGPASKGLTPLPRDFGDAQWQSSVTDAHIEQIIQYGGAAVGKSPTMPSNPDLTSKPEVVMALRKHVRSLGGPASTH